MVKKEKVRIKRGLQFFLTVHKRKLLILALLLIVTGLVMYFWFWTLIGARTWDSFLNQVNTVPPSQDSGRWDTFRDYGPGNTVWVRDEVIRIPQYDNKSDVTLITLSNSTKFLILGDHRGDFAAGNTVVLQFRVVEITVLTPNGAVVAEALDVFGDRTAGVLWEKYLFGLGLEYKQYLKEGIVNSTLRMTFEKNGISLSEGAKLGVENSHWKIEDRSGTYLVRESATQLYIYSERTELPISAGYVVVAPTIFDLLWLAKIIAGIAILIVVLKAWYILKRLVQLFVTLLIILTLIFWLFEALPLKPYERLSLNPQIKPEQKECVKIQQGYDRPATARYILFMKNMLTFNFGASFQTLMPIVDELAERLPRTLLLLGGATILEFVFGVLIGAIIAWRRKGIADKASVVVSLVFYNMPVFWLGLIFLYVFAATCGLFPLGGFYDPTKPPTNYYLNVLWHAALPMLVLTLTSLAGAILLMRTSMLEVMGEDYLVTARAKGVPEFRILYKHSARNAMLPVMSSFILAMVFAVGGAVITEQVFSYQGIGQWYIYSLGALDFPVCMALVYITSLLVLIGNLIADILYSYLDPRVRVQ